MKILSFLLIFSPFVAVAQIVPEPTMLSLQCFGGDNYSGIAASSITKTIDGGFIVSIRTNASPGSGNLDSYCTMTGSRTLYLKYNADASSLIWSKCFYPGGYIFPQLDGSFIFGETVSGVPSGWAYQISKTDATGTPLWSKTYGGQAASAVLSCMSATADGGYIMAGGTNYADTDFTTHYGSWMDEDIAIVKVDSNGNKIWGKVIGGAGNDIVKSLVATPSGGCYIVGYTSSNDNECTGNHGGNDVYLAKIDGSGNLLWHRNIGGSSNEGGYWGVSNGKGGIIIAATTTSSDGDVSHYIPFISGAKEIWAIEIDSSSNVVWDNCYGGDVGEFSYAQSVCKATDGSIWIAGVTSGKFGQIDTAYGEYDAWFVHADSVGNFLNAKVLGSNLRDIGSMVYPLSNGNVIVGGTFFAFNGSFTGLATYPTGQSVFLTVFAPQDDTKVEEIPLAHNEVKIFPNPAAEQFTIEGIRKNKYQIVVSNAVGKVIYNDSFRGMAEIKTHKWERGVYNVIVSDTDGFKAVQKLVVQ